MTFLSDITVNGVTIPAALIATEAQNHPAPPGKPGLAWRAAARALILRQLLLAEAHRLGLSPEPAELAPDLIEPEDEALIRQAMERGVRPAPVDEAQLVAQLGQGAAAQDPAPRAQVLARLRLAAEKAAWARAARAYAQELLDKAEIQGFDLGAPADAGRAQLPPHRAGA